jgi:ParB family chromosome partitioning protein
VSSLLPPAPPPPRPAAAGAADVDTARLETELAERLGAKVRIDAGRKGAGRVVITYSSLDQLDGILARLK